MPSFRDGSFELDDAATLNNQGIEWARSGRVEEAIDYFQRAVAANPGFALAHNNLGYALSSLGRLSEAMMAYENALRARPDYPEALNNLGIAHARSEATERAILYFDAALGLRYDYPEAHNNRSFALTTLGRFTEALAGYGVALRFRPDYPEAHNNLGTTLAALGQIAEAIAHFESALSVHPNFAEAHCNLARALRFTTRRDEAEGHYTKALELRPDDLETHMNRASDWLITGDFARGWAEYEWRWQSPTSGRRDFVQPPWNGEPLEGRTILLYYEQGLGDTIHYIRYASLVKARGGTVIFESQPALIPLLAGCAGIDRLVPFGSPLPEFDTHAALMSLPWILRTTLEDIPASVPYLRADAQLVEAWRQRLANDQGLRVGIHWQGSPTYKSDRDRSFPLENFAPVGELPNVRLYSLQKNKGLEQLPAFTARFPVVDLGSRLDEGMGAFVETAAVLLNLDLLITCDTAIGHLAGALGVRTWLALSWLGDARWLEERSDSPWYPTVRLFRQSEPGDWDQVFQRIAAAVGTLQPAVRESAPIMAELSAGELIDKITILEIKAERITAAEKLRHVGDELASLRGTYERSLVRPERVAELAQSLKTVNERIWDGEEAIRAFERRGEFGEPFITVARSIRELNDERAALKRRINTTLRSRLVEEKSYDRGSEGSDDSSAE